VKVGQGSSRQELDIEPPKHKGGKRKKKKKKKRWGNEVEKGDTSGERGHKRVLGGEAKAVEIVSS